MSFALQWRFNFGRTNRPSRVDAERVSSGAHRVAARHCFFSQFMARPSERHELRFHENFTFSRTLVLAVSEEVGDMRHKLRIKGLCHKRAGNKFSMTEKSRKATQGSLKKGSDRSLAHPSIMAYVAISCQLFRRIQVCHGFNL